MVRKCVFLLFAVAAMSVGNVRPSEAGPISPNNPYRSYNISGVNYGSMRWEQSHRRVSAQRYGWAPRRGGFLFRRR